MGITPSRQIISNIFQLCEVVRWIVPPFELQS
jgi:hypothetical protein